MKLIKKIFILLIILLSTFYFLIFNKVYAFESSSASFEIHGASLESISGEGAGTSFKVRSAGGQLATGLSANIKKVYAGILYWLYTLFTPKYEQIHYRWRNNDGDEENATWAASEDTLLNGLNKNTIIRIRFEISNEGWTKLDGQKFQIEYAETDNCPAGSYIPVPAPEFPPTKHWEMADSEYLTDGEITTNVPGGLTDENVTFVAGQVKDIGNQTKAIIVTSENFTEIEYSISATALATDGGDYCFRLTHAGSTVNYAYTQYAKVKLNAAPTVTNVQLNNQNDINLTENTTTLINATATVSDPNGCLTISLVTAKIYRSGVSGAEGCTDNPNNCYSVASCTQDSGSCTSLTDPDATYTCTISMQFHADPTDSGTPWASEHWQAWVKATDSGDLTGENWSPSEAPEVNSLLALDLAPGYDTIDYPAKNPGQRDDPLLEKTRVRATGNVSLDVILYGTNMTFGGNIIPVGNQRWGFGDTAPSWSSGTPLTLSSSERRELNCPKTTDSNNPQWKRIWWGIEIPSLQPAGLYSGTNTFEALRNQLPWP